MRCKRVRHNATNVNTMRKATSHFHKPRAPFNNPAEMTDCKEEMTSSFAKQIRAVLKMNKPAVWLIFLWVHNKKKHGVWKFKDFDTSLTDVPWLARTNTKIWLRKINENGNICFFQMSPSNGAWKFALNKNGYCFINYLTVWSEIGVKQFLKLR